MQVQSLMKKYLNQFMYKTYYISSHIFLAFMFVFLVGALSYAQAELPSKPKTQTSVYDEAKLMSGYERAALEQKLINYADTTSTQIVVATINSLQGEDIAMYATKWAHDWGIGQKDEDNGVLLLIAKSDRKLWITTGYGVEHLLTDALSKRIITNVITPEFKRGDFYSGIDKGTSAMIQVLSGEYQSTPQSRGNDKGGIPIVFIILFIIILFIILSNRNKGGKGGRRRNSTGSLLEAIILSNAGRGGFGGGGGFGGSSGGGSFGGGGFGGGFGGGGFGGGGAGGSW